MPVSEKKKASNKKWDEANVDRMSIVAPKGARDEIKAAAAAAGESANAYIIGAVRARMSGGDFAPVPAPVVPQGVILPDDLAIAAEGAAELAKDAEVMDFVRRAIEQQAAREFEAQQLQKCADVERDAMEQARAAAAAAGEDVPAFLARAIRQTADADERTRRLAQAAPSRSAPRETVPAERLEDQIQQRIERLRALRGTSEPIGDPADPGASDKKAAQDAPKAP